MTQNLPRFRLITLFAIITVIACALAYYRARRVALSEGEFGPSWCAIEKWKSFANDLPHFTKNGLRVFAIDRQDLPTVFAISQFGKNCVAVSPHPPSIRSGGHTFFSYPKSADKSLRDEGKRPMEQHQYSVEYSTSMLESVFSPKICYIKLALTTQKTTQQLNANRIRTEKVFSTATPARHQYHLQLEHHQRDKVLIVEGQTSDEDEYVMLFIYDLP